MPCYYPLDGWRSKKPNERGKYPIVFKHTEAQIDEPVKIPCGQCIGCRLEKSRQWAMRCVHEASLHKTNSFITLTYDDDNINEAHSLNKDDWQKFMKALRHKISPHKIRFFMAGEYGTNQDLTSLSTIGRPHFHAIIFNYDFPDKIKHSITNDNMFYTSEELTNVWGKGHCLIGECSFETAAYTARYITKKITGSEAEDHYKRIDTTTGEITYINPEFTLQSRNPGIARDWFLKHKTDLDKGFITMRGQKMQPPTFYKKQFEIYDEQLYEFQKRNAYNEIDIMDPDNTLDRLRVKEKIKLIRTKSLKRPLQ